MEEYLLETYRELILPGITNFPDVKACYAQANALCAALIKELPSEQSKQVHELWELWLEYAERAGACSYLKGFWASP